MARSIEIIKERQQVWARKHGISFDMRGYVLNFNANLFEPMQPDARAEYSSGAGAELKGKMFALHSSSALVCNFFHYWRYRNPSMIARACGLNFGYTSLTFEKTYHKPAGILGIPPHVDVELAGGTVRPIAVESKFSEQYVGNRKKLKSVYVETRGIWGKLPGCESLATRIVNDREAFEYLDAPQLLKHILGLKTEYGERNFELIYLWYSIAGEEAARHDEEIKRFEDYVGNDLVFRAITYQHVFEEIRTLDGSHSDYLNYMKDRYFQ